MKKLPLALILFAAFSTQALFAQSKAIIQAYIDQFKAIAMAEMARTGVPASITLAQGIHETGAGTSVLVRKSNNHFGIKCKTEWAGEKVYHDDDARGECFRKYDDPFISYKDHSDFLRNRSHYASLFNLDPEDYEAWAHGLKKAGYATNPKYPQILIKLIRDYNLQDYTLVVLGKKETGENEPTWAKVTKTPANETTESTIAMVSQEPKTVYPQGVFSINNTKVIAVAKGTSYLKIAIEQDLSLARLFEFNDLNDGDIAREDGLLFLQRKRKTGASETHTVAAGETLYSIAQAEGIRLESLLQYNFLTAGAQVQIGETLYLQSAAPSMPKLVNGQKANINARANERPRQTEANEESASPAVVFHVVQPKETLYSIAKKYEVGVEDLQRWNELGTSDLRIGQQIKITKTAFNANRQTAR